MHIHKATGDLVGLLRGTEAGVPERMSFRNMYGKSGIGEAPYQKYDLDVTKSAIGWLKDEARKTNSLGFYWYPMPVRTPVYGARTVL